MNIPLGMYWLVGRLSQVLWRVSPICGCSRSPAMLLIGVEDSLVDRCRQRVADPRLFPSLLNDLPVLLFALSLSSSHHRLSPSVSLSLSVARCLFIGQCLRADACCTSSPSSRSVVLFSQHPYVRLTLLPHLQNKYRKAALKNKRM